MSAISYSVASRPVASHKEPLAHKFLAVLLWLLFALVVAVFLLPVILLFVGTAVPTYLAAVLLVIDGVAIWLLVRSRRALWQVLATLLVSLTVAVVATTISQLYAATPPIVDANGDPLPGSIAVMEKVTLGGSEQWITMRGKDVNKPVLLYLGIGGPGAGGFPANALTLAPLEDHFVVVNWDQPGTGKSYKAGEIPTLTVERFVADAHELTLMLRERFGEEKIYVLGLSWGTILGIKLVQQYPDLFYAYVGNGQMVNTTENDRIGYELALQDSLARGDTAMVNRLTRNGPPPYSGAGMAMKYATYNNVLFRYMDSPTLELILLLVPQMAREYGLVDKVNFARGLIDSFPVVYSQLHDLDFTTQAAVLDVPTYFLVGRNDVNAVAALVERYYNVLQAPRKQLIWLEGSHGATPEQLGDAMVKTVLEQTYPKPEVAPIPNGGPSDAQEVEAFLDAVLPRQLQEHHIAGAGAVVVADGEVLVTKGYGYADVASQQPVQAEKTLLRTDSTGKLFVWTAVMQLVEAGLVDLETDINSYLDFQIPATFPEAITLKHLLSHSAGFEDQGYLYALDASKVKPAGVWLAENIPQRVRPPGMVTAYSNYGTALAGYIVERVAGLPFEEYVEERIFQPLAMESSSFRQPLPEHLATSASANYHYDNVEFRAIPFTYLSVPAMGEGHTTVTDMAAFMNAHLASGDSPILRAATLRQTHSQLFANDPRVTGIAYGFAESVQNGQRILRHEGNNPGVSSSTLMLLPDKRVGVYVAYNSNGGFVPGEEFRQAFLNHYYPARVTPPQAVALTATQSEALVGSYRSTRMFYSTFAKVVALIGGNYDDIRVTVNGQGEFVTEGIGAAALTWIAVEPKRLRLANGGQDSHGDLVFVSDEASGQARLLITNNPYRAYEKIGWFEGTDFQLLVLMVCELVFVLTLIALPLYLLKRKAGNQAQMSISQHWAGRLLSLVCLLAILFPIGLLLTVERAILYEVTWALLAVLTMPLLTIVLAGVALVLTVRNWQSLRWVERVHFGAVFVALVVFAVWQNYWNLLGYHL